MHPDIRSGQFLGKAAAKPKEEEAVWRDPVCGTSLGQRNAVGRVKHKKVLFYFCSPGCQAAFLGDPHKYLPDCESHPESPTIEGREL